MGVWNVFFSASLLPCLRFSRRCIRVNYVGPIHKNIDDLKKIETMKGVFCLEGFWYNDHRDKTTVYPILDLANKYYDVPFLHHKCGTKEEFVFALKRWTTRSFSKKYPLLYLAFHGCNGMIKIGKEELTLAELEEMMRGKCSGTVIYFSSCETMNVDRRKLKQFLKCTEALAILGYRQKVNWLASAFFDIQLLYYLQKYPYDLSGIAGMKNELLKSCRAQVKELDFVLLSG
jgi:hypothetical protein